MNQRTMKQVKHIIWDWNGTLFDDAWLNIEIINRLLAQRGLPLTDEARYGEEFGFPVAAYYQHLGFDFSKEPFPVLAQEYTAQYDRLRYQCDLRPGARQVLATLAARGYTHSLLSAYEQSRLEEMVAYTRLHGQFSALVGISDVLAGGKIAQGKRFLDARGGGSTGYVMIGDTVHDYEVAAALGIACILIPSGHCSRARLTACNAEVVDSVEDLLALDIEHLNLDLLT